MAGLTRDELTGEYAWTDFSVDDPKVCGPLDDTHFNPNEGHEVLYLINLLTQEWDLKNVKSGHKMERMIRDLPAEVRSQADVKAWIKQKWGSYKFKDKSSAKVLKREEATPPPVPPTGEDIHLCSNCKSTTRCEVVEQTTPVPVLSQQPAGMRYFQRRRQCSACRHVFETVEVDASLLHELAHLRNLVEKIKKELGA